MFLTRVEAAVSVMRVEASIKKIMAKWFKDFNLPMPRIKIANNLKTSWLGRCKYRTGEDNTWLEIQKKITDDDKTLDRILTHEIIHHWEFLVLSRLPTSNTSRLKARQAYTLGDWQSSHGKPFKDWCAKINAVMGKDYVTEKSDGTYALKSLNKDYYVLIAPSPAYNRLSWAWAARPSATQWGVIKWFKDNRKAKLVKTRDDRFLDGQRIAKNGSMSLPHTGTEDGKTLSGFLQEMYESGKDVA